MRIYYASNLMDAQIVKDQLDLARIPSEIRNVQASHLQGALPFGIDSLPTLYLLNPQDLEKAAKIISEHKSKRKYEETLKNWECPHCHETNPGNFAICWNCQNSPETLKNPKNANLSRKSIQDTKAFYKKAGFWIILMLILLIWFLLKSNK